MEINETLEKRKNEYGEYSGQATLSQSLKNIMRDSKNWDNLSPDKKESLDMIVHKIARILNGNPNYKDNWHDIIGYAKLIENTL